VSFAQRRRSPAAARVTEGSEARRQVKRLVRRGHGTLKRANGHRPSSRGLSSNPPTVNWKRMAGDE
jgi:hypothetical protein